MRFCLAVLENQINKYNLQTDGHGYIDLESLKDPVYAYIHCGILDEY